MKTRELKDLVTVVKELNESYVDTIHAFKGVADETRAAKQLWQNKKKSKLIKLGLALIVFPEPTPISETIGSVLLAAGTVQERVRRQGLYIEDVLKTFKDVLREIGENSPCH